METLTGTAAAPALMDGVLFPRLIELLLGRGFRVIAPVVRNDAIELGEIHSAAELPVGRGDLQSAARYQLTRRNDASWFGYVVGPMAWKSFLYPAEARLWRAERRRGALHILDEPDDEPPLAFVGVRPCELAAIQVHDRVLAGGPWKDPAYVRRRERLFIVAVDCAEPGGSCFCASMGTGPSAGPGHDLGLTELVSSERHAFLAAAGSPAGVELLAALAPAPATAADRAEADAQRERAVARMGRHLETTGLKELLDDSSDHPHWDAVAARCLGCANCTMVCPTCFCATVEDTTDLKGMVAERRRRWDSCFTLDFSYIHGGSVRPSLRARYRQWMTHKLSTWVDQFGVSGCVGCGRCITWCPAGIDLTEEAATLREGLRG